MVVFLNKVRNVKSALDALFWPETELSRFGFLIFLCNENASFGQIQPSLGFIPSEDFRWKEDCSFWKKTVMKPQDAQTVFKVFFFNLYSQQVLKTR